MRYSIFFKPISTTFNPPSNDEKFRIVTKTSNIYNNNILSVELSFRYNRNSDFDLLGKQITLFHMGVGTSNSGIAIVLKQGTNVSDPIQIGLIASTGNNVTWETVTNTSTLATSFYNLNDIDISTYYILLTYNYSHSNKNINFYVVEFKNPTTKTTPDWSFTVTSATSSVTSLNPGNHWGFGSCPQTITTTDGYLGDSVNHSYNSYVAQNIELSFLRTWNIIIPSTSSTNTEYAMFNSDTSHSLYNLNANYTLVPTGTNNLNFQLNITGTDLLSSLYNNAVTGGSGTLVTSTTNTTNFPSLDGFGINSNIYYTIANTSTLNCLLKGTQILTPDGYKLIENITLDDLIITYDNRIVRIKNINKDIILAKDDDTIPYIIRKGQYGAFEDLYISKSHGVLINGDYFDIPCRIGLELSNLQNELLTYYHIETENYLYDTIIANGVAVESYYIIVNE
jgi:hypothetical protein